MLNSNKIKDLYKARKMSLDELASEIGMSNTGLHNAIKANDFKVSVLVRIAEALDVPVSYFFDEEGKVTQTNTNGENSYNDGNKQTINGTNVNQKIIINEKDSEIEKLKQKIESLYNRLADKDEIIKEKDKTILEKKSLIDLLISRKDEQVNKLTEEKEKQVIILTEEKDKQIELYKKMVEMLEKKLEEQRDFFLQKD